MIGLLAWLLASAGAPAAVPPPVEQLTADCTRPTFATDQLVCGDPELLSLDQQLAAALGSFTARSSRWLEAQPQWFLRRSQCAFQADHRSCALAAYRERLIVVRSADGTTAVGRAKCNDPSVQAVRSEVDRFFLMSADGAMIGVAVKVRQQGDWVPYLVARQHGSRLEASGATGGTLRCRLLS